MKKISEPAYIGPQQIMEDWDVSKATAYNIIKKLNAQLIKEHPTALNEDACLRRNQLQKVEN